MGYSAGDIERYSYCPLSWWLAKDGVEGEGEAITAGIVKHERKGAFLQRWEKLVSTRKTAIETALYLALVAASAATIAIEVTFLPIDGIYTQILALLGLFWLIVSLIFLLRATRTEEEARKVEIASGIVSGELEYSDLDRPAQTLRSEKYELAGRPDYIVRRKGALIPVEIKTGKSPEEPHESHVLQLATYCTLVEEVYKERPPYGILSYEERAFEVPFSEALKDRVLETVLRMRLAEHTGEVHRNHNRAGKCKGCSRRDHCPERLA